MNMSYLHFLAGIGLMLYGIYTLRKGSDQLFGLRLRTLIQRATRSNLRSLFTGFLMSILTPSSTAIALLAMEAVQAGYIGVHQVLIFMLGANIGFTCLASSWLNNTTSSGRAMVCPFPGATAGSRRACTRVRAR